MPVPRTDNPIIRFGTFELDAKEGRLTKSGLRVRLQGQPFQILTLLLERAGEVVTREEIRKRLWSGQTFVEFDDALNTAVGKLRAAIGDAAENPRFVETVPRRGYRFIAPVTWPQAMNEVEPSQASIEPSPVVPVPGGAQPMVQSKSTGHEVSSTSGAATSRRRLRRYAFGSATAVVILAGAAVIYWKTRPANFKISAKDAVVVADFVNNTGEAVFDDALHQALEIGLEQSPSIQIVPDRKTAVLFTQMGHSADEHITGRSAMEVCQRAGGKATIQGSIASLGTVYLIGLVAIRCDNGEPIANEQAQAHRKEDVVDVLGQVTAQLRSRLGESLPSIQKYNAPLEQATTTSLDALNAYSQALLTWDKKGNRDSLPLFKRAVELDPNFAQAHGSLATIYYNLGQGELARASMTRAYELRARVTEAERSSIEARYYEFVTGELDKAEQVRTFQVKDYPESANAFNHLGNIDGKLGRYEESAQDYRRALEIDPTRGGSYSELAISELALNRVDEASAVLAEADKRSLQTEELLKLKYRVAFVRGDDGEMAKLLAEGSNPPETQALLLAEESNNEAFHGHLKRAVDLSRRASSLMEAQGDKDSAARYLGQAAIRQAEAGDSAGAERLVGQAQRLSHDLDVVTLAALTQARLGNVAEAQALMKQLNEAFPAGTYVQKYWLPTIRAAMQLRKGMGSRAVEELALLTPPLEFAGPRAFPVPTLYPTYLRGEAYLATGDAQHAEAEFEKMEAHKGTMVNYPLASMALAELGRAYALAGDGEKAKRAFSEFFAAWKDADQNVEFLKRSQAEFSKLR